MKVYLTKYKRRILLIRTCIYCLFCIFILTLLFIGNGLFEKGVVNNEIKIFKERGEFEKTVVLQGQNVSYYKVKKKYDYEDVSRYIYDTNRYSKNYIGSKTDVILTSRNPLRMYGDAIIRDVAGILSKNFFIGHATINLTDDGSLCIESVGNDTGYKGVRIVENTWIDTEVRYGNDAQIIIGLRLKNTTKEIREEICNNLIELEGKEYNKLLLFYNKNKYYCTDLISRTLKKSKITVNYDSFYTTGNDIIVSNETYIIFICERIKEGYFNIYYLN